MEANKHVVMLTVGNTVKYQERLRSHTTVNTEQGLFDLIVIATLEYTRSTEEIDSSMLRYVTNRHQQLISLEIDTVDKFLKNATVIQNNLELLGYKKYEYNEFVYLIHTAVDYFMLHDVSEYAYAPSESTTPSEYSCYVNEHKVQGKNGIRKVPNIWIDDSGDLCHMTCNDAGMYDCRRINFCSQDRQW
jgi:hypothetical protein